MCDSTRDVTTALQLGEDARNMLKLHQNVLQFNELQYSMTTHEVFLAMEYLGQFT